MFDIVRPLFAESFPKAIPGQSTSDQNGLATIYIKVPHRTDLLAANNRSPWYRLRA
jgi:hypothetical protein